MRDVAIYNFYGKKDCGKTTLMSDVIKKLVDGGYRVAAVKHTTGKHTIDKEGTDTFMHGEAGAKLVVFSSPLETSFIFKDELGFKDILEVISSVGVSDVVLFEGYKHENIPGIDVGDRGVWDERAIERVVREIEDEINVYSVSNRLPHLDCGSCGNSTCIELARDIIKGNAEFDHCVVDSAVRLQVNGENIELSPFPEEMMKKTILGMLSSLKGVEKVNEVKIKFSTRDEP